MEEMQTTPAPTVEPGGSETLDELRRQLEAVQAEATALQEALARAEQQRHAAQAERDTAIAAAAAAADAAQARLTQLQAQLLDAERRVLLASHTDLIPELVTGSSIDELTASVDLARAAFARALEAARAQLASTPVPTGASTRDLPVDEPLSPMDRIIRGLRS